jgi:hypothetical protein
MATVKPEALLEYIAGTLRHEIGPAVGESFPKTQAFMASVILEKLARQVRLAGAHAQADRDDRTALAHDLRAHIQASTSSRVRDAVTALTDAEDGKDGEDAALSGLVEALYATRDELGAERFDLLLTRVRRTLRARLDRQLEYAS